jgi:hypothetical protein
MSRELDYKIAELMGWTYWDFDFRDYDGKYPMFITMDQLLLVFDEANKHREFSPSTDIAAAMLVVEKLVADGYYVDIGIDKHGAQVQLDKFGGEDISWIFGGSIRGKDVPEAICLAAVMASEAE